MASIREETVNSAVNFLKDPKVQKSTLQARVSFLESKGLTSEEIEEALRRAKGGAPSNATTVAPSQPIQGATPGQNYLLPLLKTPTANELENDKQALSDQFTFTSERLDLVKTDTNIVRRSIEETSLGVKEALESLDTVLKDLKQQEIKRDTDIKSLQEEIKTIHELIPKILEKSKDSQNQALAELQNELKSLKSLIINRRTAQTTSSIGEIAATGSSFSPSNTSFPLTSSFPDEQRVDQTSFDSLGETNGAKSVVEAPSDITS
ncbi:12309_t:CDS:2 [Ambispora leptoticha]|uniref:Peroxisomal membrane protein PEX14 n=1 Tax=Ambispora leptoticha TaxID=144679 RepID=A0A9N9H404_9GLOM|nr:12309_t:CDS:2 [Ambispora leptoticha]